MIVSTIDVTIIVLYLLALLGVGYYASRKVKNMEDYAIAGRRFGYPILLGTLIATAIGAANSIGMSGKAYKVGIAFFFVGIAYGVGVFLFGFIAPTIRKLKIWTIPEVLSSRYGDGIKIVMSIVMILGIIASFGGHLVAMGLAVSTVFGNLGITYTEAILAAGIILIIYTMLGGLLAVAYTDFIQTAIIIIGVGILLPIFMINDVGGISVAWKTIKPEPGNFWGGMSAIYIIAIFITQIAFVLVDPSIWQRASAGRDTKTVRRSVFATSGVFFIWCFIVVGMGAMAASIFPELGAQKGGADAAIPMSIAHHLPIVIKGLCLAALLAAMMSTADTYLLIAGTTFSRDLFRSFRPQTKDKTLLLISRIVILFIGVLGIIFAINIRGVFNIIMLAFAIWISGVLVPVVAAVYWKKATKAGAFSSTIVATITVVGLNVVKKKGALPVYLEPIMVSLALSLILMVVVSLATYKPENATRRLFDDRDEEQE